MDWPKTVQPMMCRCSYGGRFASLVEALDECEEFDLTIANDVEESSVEVRAPDTDLEVATTAVDRHTSPKASLLDALDHDLAMDEGQVGGDVDNTADAESDIVSDLGTSKWIERQFRRSGMLSCQWTRSIWTPSSGEGRVL